MEKCDSATVTTYAFSSKLGEFCTATVPHPVAYSIIGFCNFIGLTRSAFYETYKPAFPDFFERIQNLCEEDILKKSQQGQIPPKLTGLILSKYGYSARAEDTATEDALEEARKLLEGLDDAIQHKAD